MVIKILELVISFMVRVEYRFEELVLIFRECFFSEIRRVDDFLVGLELFRVYGVEFRFMEVVKGLILLFLEF